MVNLTGKLQTYPARTSFYCYLTLVTIGAFALRHPWCSAQSDHPISWLDALFTATSALCVTGLSVRSTVADFSFLGQWVILALIQIGGIGIMTITSFVISQLTHGQIGLRQRSIMVETIGVSKVNLQLLAGRVLLMTVFIEMIGALFLLLTFAQHYPFPTAVYHSIFHSISAFCNAGFALHDDSLMPFKTDWLLNTTIMGLIITGGIGYPVLTDLVRCVRRSGSNVWGELSLHSKLMLIVTTMLIVGGALVLFLLERDGVLKQASWGECFWVPLFHSVSCRTAGFNSIPIGALSEESLLFSIILMLIGAGACSTGGGLKVTTVALIGLHAWSRFNCQKHIQIFRRTIPIKAVDRAMASTILFLFIVGVAVTLLMIVERQTEYRHPSNHLFLDFLFEVSSALGTVGLSAGLTTNLEAPGRMILIILMFIGRLGPLSVFAALSRERKEPSIRYANEEPLVG